MAALPGVVQPGYYPVGHSICPVSREEAKAGPGDTACSLECKFIGKNANDPFHFIPLTHRAGSNNWLLPTPVTAATLLTLCKGPAILQVQLPALWRLNHLLPPSGLNVIRHSRTVFLLSFRF